MNLQHILNNFDEKRRYQAELGPHRNLSNVNDDDDGDEDSENYLDEGEEVEEEEEFESEPDGGNGGGSGAASSSSRNITAPSSGGIVTASSSAAPSSSEILAAPSSSGVVPASSSGGIVAAPSSAASSSGGDIVTSSGSGRDFRAAVAQSPSQAYSTGSQNARPSPLPPRYPSQTPRSHAGTPYPREPSSPYPREPSSPYPREPTSSYPRESGSHAGTPYPGKPSSLRSHEQGSLRSHEQGSLRSHEQGSLRSHEQGSLRSHEQGSLRSHEQSSPYLRARTPPDRVSSDRISPPKSRLSKAYSAAAPLPSSSRRQPASASFSPAEDIYRLIRERQARAHLPPAGQASTPALRAPPPSSDTIIPLAGANAHSLAGANAHSLAGANTYSLTGANAHSLAAANDIGTLSPTTPGGMAPPVYSSSSYSATVLAFLNSTKGKLIISFVLLLLVLFIYLYIVPFWQSSSSKRFFGYPASLSFDENHAKKPLSTGLSPAPSKKSVSFNPLSFFSKPTAQTGSNSAISHSQQKQTQQTQPHQHQFDAFPLLSSQPQTSLPLPPGPTTAPLPDVIKPDVPIPQHPSSSALDIPVS